MISMATVLLSGSNPFCIRSCGAGNLQLRTRQRPHSSEGHRTLFGRVCAHRMYQACYGKI
jgi:hypothetical protein